MINRLPTSLLATTAGLFLLLSASVASAEDAAQVAIKDFAFEPAMVTVTVGTTVTWTNADDEPHLVVSTTKAFQSEVLDTNQSYAFEFDVPGKYEYYCTLHPHMKGIVQVRPKN